MASKFGKAVTREKVAGWQKNETFTRYRQTVSCFSVHHLVGCCRPDASRKRILSFVALNPKDRELNHFHKSDSLQGATVRPYKNPYLNLMLIPKRCT